MSVGIDGELLAGSLPVKQLQLVQMWAAIHGDELYGDIDIVSETLYEQGVLAENVG